MGLKSTSQKLKPKIFIFPISLTTTMEWGAWEALHPTAHVKGFSFSKWWCVVLLSVKHIPQRGHIISEIFRSRMVWHLKKSKGMLEWGTSLRNPIRNQLIGLFKRPISAMDQIKHY
jgi:hypothetical protein